MERLKRTHKCRITFRHDDGDDTRDIIITTPEPTPDFVVRTELKKVHDILSYADNNEDYNPEMLVESTCEPRKWTWKIFDYKPDIDMTFD